MTELTINVGSIMIVNGVTIGDQAMDASRKLRLYKPEPQGEGPESRDQSQESTRLIVAEVLKQLREGAAQIPIPEPPPSPEPEPSPETPSPGVEAEAESRQEDTVQELTKHWTTDPVRVKTQHLRPETQGADGSPHTERVTLRHCFDRVSARRSWAVETRKQHLSVVNNWEEWFASRNLPEPDIRQITSGMFCEFAKWREWDPACRNAHRNKGCWETMLKSYMIKGPGVKDGLPPDEAVLSWLPDHGLPPEGGAERSRTRFNDDIKDKQWTPFRETDCSKLIEACRPVNWPVCDSGLVTPYETWCAVWSLEWYFGITMEDVLMMPVACLDFAQWGCGTLTYTRIKTGENVGPLPLPSVLRPLLKKLADAALGMGRESLFSFPLSLFECGEGGDSKSTGRLYARVRPMYQRAGLTPRERGGKKRWFHSWRSAAVNRWKAIAPQYQERITGHSPKSVSDRSYVEADKDELIPLIESYPVPDALIRLTQELHLETEPETEPETE